MRIPKGYKLKTGVGFSRQIKRYLWCPKKGDTFYCPEDKTIYEYLKWESIPKAKNFIYCLTMDGKFKWKFETEGRILSKVAVKDVNKDGELEIFFGSCDNSVYALKADGKLMWSYETDFWVVASPIIADIDTANPDATGIPLDIDVTF